MSEKIPLGGGAYMEPDDEPRNSPYHRRIVKTAPIPNTRAGNDIELDCGHQVIAFGNLGHAGGVALCTQCRDADIHAERITAGRILKSTSDE